MLSYVLDDVPNATSLLPSSANAPEFTTLQLLATTLQLLATTLQRLATTLQLLATTLQRLATTLLLLATTLQWLVTTFQLFATTLQLLATNKGEQGLHRGGGGQLRPAMFFESQNLARQKKSPDTTVLANTFVFL